jgi:histidinol-phosphate/aromatic aminotransferase/cobyric acid decarboxylase-like protein
MHEHSATPVAHGGLIHAEIEALGLRPDAILDVSVNVNPYGPCPAVLRAVLAAPIHRYPDPSAGLARRALAGGLGVDPAGVVVGNGAVDLLWTLARALLRPDDVVGIVEPAFSEMRAAATRSGARIEGFRTRAEDDFAVDLPDLDAFLAQQRPRLLYLCTPSNPVGIGVATADLLALAERHPHTTIIVDESFLSLSERHADAEARLPETIVRIRSLTKDHALAGLRIGYLATSPAIAARVEAERPPWSVNAPAQAAAVATTTPEARHFVAACRDRLLHERDALVAALRAIDLRVHPSETIFVLVDLGPEVAATRLRQALLERHAVLVRDATSFGLSHHLRLGVRPRADRDRLMTALRMELSR